jgi:hypothetical protein
MKKTAIFLAFLFCLNVSVFSQIKVWNNELMATKTKGVYSLLENPVSIEKSTENSAFIGSATVAGIMIPFAIKYVNYAIKKATSRDEKDYRSENTCLNNQVISFSSFKDSVVTLKAKQLFYKKGDIQLNTATAYTFKFIILQSSLEVELIKTEENFIPVKLKKNYDFLMSNFDISISAEVDEEIDSVTCQHKILDLGTITIYKINPSFKSGKTEVLNSGVLLLPSLTDKGKHITVSQLIIKVKINHINPYGSTSSSLNDFLEKNSETNEGFLNSILIKKEEGK